MQHCSTGGKRSQLQITLALTLHNRSNGFRRTTADWAGAQSAVRPPRRAGLTGPLHQPGKKKTQNLISAKSSCLSNFRADWRSCAYCPKTGDQVTNGMTQ